MVASTASSTFSNENVGRLLIKLSFPSIIALLANSFYNIVDAIIIGRVIGPVAMGAISIVLPLQRVIMAVPMMLGLGASTLISVRLGKRESAGAQRAAGNAFFLSGVAGLALVLLGLSFLRPIMVAFGSTPSILPFASRYGMILILGSPFYMAMITALQLIRSEGKASYAMIAMMSGTFLNVGLDLLFVLIFDMGITGVAVATVLSQFVSFLFVLLFYLTDRSDIRLRVSHLRFDKKTITEMLPLSFPPLVNQLSNILTPLTINNLLRVHAGALHIAVFGIVYRLMFFLRVPVYGTVQGYRPIVGYNYGAGEMHRVKRVTAIALLSLFVFSAVCCLVFFFLPRSIIGIFSRDMNVIESGSHALRIAVLLFPFFSVHAIGRNYFQAIKNARSSVLLFVLPNFVLFIPAAIIFPMVFGIDGIWWAFPFSDFVTAMVAAI